MYARELAFTISVLRNPVYTDLAPMEREHAAHDSTVSSRNVGASICLQCSMAFLCNSTELRLRKVQLIKELQMVRLPRLSLRTLSGHIDTNVCNS